MFRHRNANQNSDSRMTSAIFDEYIELSMLLPRMQNDSDLDRKEYLRVLKRCKEIHSSLTEAEAHLALQTIEFIQREAVRLSDHPSGRSRETPTEGATEIKIPPRTIVPDFFNRTVAQRVGVLPEDVVVSTSIRRYV